MILYNQKEIIDALSNPKLYPPKWGVKEVKIRQSHIALLFLAGGYAFKLKRAVLLPNIDFSTPSKRRLACVQEMKRSTVYAPHLVLGVRSVRRLPNGRICIGGKAGEEIDTILIMKRIPDESILGQNLPNPSFDRFQVMDLAEKLAELHSKAKIFRTKWGFDTIQKTLLETERVLSCFYDIFDKTKLNILMRSALENLAKNARLIALRQKSGHVRKCHGDLLLCNIAYENGKFLFFSPIEYSETMDCIDTLYDLAFLMMDFEARGMRRLTNMLFNHYMAYTNDLEGYPLLPLYQTMRAATRAAVCAKKATMLENNEKQQAIDSARQYFELAYHFMTSHQPILIACGGLSGSGKSRIAREIGGLMNPAPGAVILRDDIVKQQINGCGIHGGFDRDVCDKPVVERVVYDVLRQQARTALKIGSCVIVDALFYNEAERQAIEELAQEMNVPFVGLWMDAPLATRVERIHTRKRNPSEVKTQDELEQQLSLETGDVSWYQIMTDKGREETIVSVIDLLKQISPVPLFVNEPVKTKTAVVCGCTTE